MFTPQNLMVAFIACLLIPELIGNERYYVKNSWYGVALSVPSCALLYAGGFFDDIGAPQGIWGCLFLCGMFISYRQHGTRQQREFFIHVAASVATLGLYAWGGFFS